MNRAELAIIIYCLFVIMSIAPTDARPITDQIGEKIDLPATPQRVVSLAPSLTEMVYSVQAESRLVGATRYSNFPEAARKIPRVGSYVQLDLERIVALEPDLCLATKDGNPRHTIDAIRSLGIPVFVIDPRSIEQIMDGLLLLGEVLDAARRAEELVSDMQQRISLVKERIASSPSRPGVFFQISDMPMVSAGKNSFIDKLITLAGGTNLAGSMSGYPRFSWEDIIVLQPEIVLISSMAGSRAPETLKASWQKWPQIPAVKNNRLHVVDADLFNRPTARLVAGLEILAEILHPVSFEKNIAK